MAKQEQNLIKLDEFNIQQLPELQNKKQEVSAKLEQFKYVEIKDNTTYEEAKKSRTGARTLRTDLQKEQKAVEKKIKDNVLVPVKNAYDELIDSVLPIENKQQDEVSRWEDIKEQERLEKALLEIKRVEGIKAKIKEFGDVWEQAFSLMKYENIKECIDTFQESVEVIDVKELEEFEILFTDKVDDLRFKLDSRITLLTTEEELRLERERLAQIQAEHNRVNAIKTKIDSWEKNWLYVINNLEFRNISVTQNEFETQTALDCQELQSEYAEKRNQIQELLSAKVSQLKEAEEQRIERENFLKEKAEFEEKMRLEEQKKKEAEANAQPKKELTEEEKKYFSSRAEEPIKADGYSTSEETQEEFEKNNNLEKGIPWYETTSKEVEEKFNKLAEEKLPKEIDFVEHLLEQEDTPIIDSRVFSDQSKTIFQDLSKKVVLEETWESIKELFIKDSDHKNNISDIDAYFVFEWLSENYNVPTKK